MNTYICIVARLASSRLPKKALLKIVDNLSILEVLIKRLKNNFKNNQIILATSNLEEDYELINLAKSQKIKFFRGSEENVLDRIINSCKTYNDCENIVRITGDNPLTDPYVLGKMINQHVLNKADYTYTESIPIGTRPEIISMNFLKFLSNNIEDKNNTEYLTFYLKKNLGQLKNLFEIKYEKILSNETLTVDTYEDFDYLKRIFVELNSDPLVSLKEIINVINNKKIEKKRSKIQPKIINQNSFRLKKNFYE
tara:strand:- start:2844 stop:3602 length:759 start_codon:yes stop_codon:yes gene_type:complete